VLALAWALRLVLCEARANMLHTFRKKKKKKKSPRAQRGRESAQHSRKNTPLCLLRHAEPSHIPLTYMRMFTSHLFAQRVS
jgi:hypothetical protein